MKHQVTRLGAFFYAKAMSRAFTRTERSAVLAHAGLSVLVNIGRSPRSHVSVSEREKSEAHFGAFVAKKRNRRFTKKGISQGEARDLTTARERENSVTFIGGIYETKHFSRIC